MTPHPRLLPDVLAARAELQPDALALVVDGAGSLTYREWDRRSNAFAHGLAAREVRRGDRVGLLFSGHHWLDYAVAFFGTLKAGAVAVPVPTELPPAQIDRILVHAGTSALCAPPDVLVGALRLPKWDPEDIARDQGDDPSPAATDANALAQILYTSGTTGVPKGVACSHANLLFGIVTQGPELDFARRQHVALHALPIGVNAAQVELTRAAHRLATTVILPTFDPERFAAMVAAHRATVLLLVPAMAIMLVNSGAFQRHDTSSVRRIRLTGAPSPAALLRRLAEAVPESEIVNEYALTESTPTAITTVYDPARPGSVGRPGPNQRVQVTAPTGEPCPAGEVGEVWLSTPGAPTRSYFRDPEATSAVFDGGWLRTGDLGFLDEDGFLHLLDRQSDLIISGGRNISSVQVEAVLQECPAVAEAAVLGIPHEILGEQVAAAVVLRSPITAADLKRFAREWLPPYAVPQSVFFLDRLPRGISGKVPKADLRARLCRELAQDVILPRSPTEEGVAGIWARILGLEQVSVNDRFTDLGGQSISALEVVAEVRRRYSVRLDVADLEEADTVAALAARLDASLPSETDESGGSADAQAPITRRTRSDA